MHTTCMCVFICLHVYIMVVCVPSVYPVAMYGKRRTKTSSFCHKAHIVLYAYILCTRLFDSSNFALATRTCALILITYNLTLNRLLGSDCVLVVAVAFFVYLFDMNAVSLSHLRRLFRSILFCFIFSLL